MCSPREPFSKRQGFIGQPKEITIREDAPKNLRFAFLEITRSIARDYRSHPEQELFRNVVARTLGEWVDRDVWLHYNHAWKLVERLVYGCEWPQLYDLMEAVASFFEETHPEAAKQFSEQLNELFVEQGIGWQLVSGEIVTRGDEVFEGTIQSAARELADRPTAKTRIQEAIRDLSRRPKPDLSGAIFHAFAAMESVIGDIRYTPEEVRENTNHTFGAFLKQHPDLFPSEDFREGFQRLWKYANNEGSRHGKEGIEPARDEAELIVSLAAALVTYLNRKHPE